MSTGPIENQLPAPIEVSVRRILRRDLNRTWEFLKLVFRGVNKQTVEYQRPRSKARFVEVYEDDGIEQLLFEVSAPGGDVIVGYAECAYEISGSDNWMNERYFNNREMRPLFVDELAVHPGYQGQGVGRFVLEQIDHLARLRGCTHLVLEVAENNENALRFYRGRQFYKLDAAIFMAKKVEVAPDLLPPRQLANRPPALKAPSGKAPAAKAPAKTATKPAAKRAVKPAGGGAKGPGR
ncbi:MAG: GNAT family N-acetyltransferase [Myxococcales bacterium]|nr:GNAT family N-acetyltransferase [Myxococcales bacterium]